MKSRPLVLSILLLAILAGAAILVFNQGQDGEQLPDLIEPTLEQPKDDSGSEAVAEAAGKEEARAEPAVSRQRVDEASGPGEESDPEIRKALSGFKGRLVYQSGLPAPDKAVCFYRLDAEIIENPGFFALEAGTFEPEVKFTEGTTGEDGEFQVTGVWPATFYLLLADLGGDHQKTRFIQKTPGPGQIIDLGDILLEDLGSISGLVVDEDGEPISGAMVRAADVPGTALDFVPVQRFDPDGALIMDMMGDKLVVHMPAWVRKYHDMLPIPMTRTAADGTFKLRSVVPGPNVVAVNVPETVPLLRKSVMVRAGKEKKLGKLRMKEGEIVEGKVLEGEGDDRPVAGAEILLAARNTLIPVHFASYCKPSSAQGTFSMAGFPSPQIYAAVRRGPADAWIVHGPVSVAADLVLRLPARHSLTLRLKSQAGRALGDARFKLMASPSRRGGGPGMGFASLGLFPWIPTKDRTELLKDGRYRLNDLNLGHYSLAVTCKGHAAARLDFFLKGDLEAELILPASLSFQVTVQDADRKPIRNAKVYMGLRPEMVPPVQEMPLCAGRTDKAGQLLVEDAREGCLILSAIHPAFGWGHMQTKLPASAPLVITLPKPGTLTGVLHEKGRPPKLRKWTVMVERHWGNTRGAMPDMPRLVVPDEQGSFEVIGLTPGKYRVHAMSSLDAFGTPGGIVQVMTRAYMMDTGPRQTCTITSGMTTHIEFDAVAAAEVTGPAARITGTVMLNGRPATGMVMMSWSDRSTRRAEVDASGRFDLGRVKASQNVWLQLTDPKQGNVFNPMAYYSGGLWSRSVKVEEGKDLHFDIDISTSSASGVVLDVEGNPAKQVEVRAQGRVKSTDGKEGSYTTSHARAITDDRGHFHMKKLVAGVYSFRIRNNKAGHAHLKGIEVQAGVPASNLTLRLQRVYAVSGTLDLRIYSKKPGSLYMSLSGEEDPGRSYGAQVDLETGKYSVDGVPSGRYRVHIWAGGVPPEEHQATGIEIVVVAGQDVKDLILQVEINKPKPKPKTKEQGKKK